MLRGELTPEQHARIRRHLALIPVYIWVVYSWMHVLVRIPQDEPVRDFAHFYTQGVIALERDAASLYDIDRMADVAQRVLPGHQRVLYPPVYGPQMSVLFRPIAMLPYVPARHLWLVVTLVVYAGCTYAIWRVCPRLKDSAGSTALLLIAAPALHYVLGFIQVSALGLVCVTAGYLALRAHRPFAAGFALGSLAYKPPLAIGVGFVLLCSALLEMLAKPKLAHDMDEPKLAGDMSERRLVLGAIVAAVAQLAVGTLYWGPSILAPYFAALTRLPDVTAAMEPNKYHMHSWRTFFDLLGLPGPVAFAAFLLAAGATLIGALMCWRTSGSLALRYSALLIATILVDPHLYAYDLILLIPAFLVLWDWVLGQPERQVRDVLPRQTSSQTVVAQAFRPAAAALRRWASLPFNAVFLWLVYICYLSPLFVTLADLWRIQLSPLLLGLLGIVILRVLHGEECRLEPVVS